MFRNVCVKCCERFFTIDSYLYTGCVHGVFLANGTRYGEMKKETGLRVKEIVFEFIRFFEKIKDDV